jgi:DNA-binding CsgD family transcriptional regulator
MTMETGEGRRTGMAKLPEHQRACLRRVLEHKSSKEIALELGISPHTVDQRLKAAMQILGVRSRVAAARLLAEHEGRTHPPLVYQSPDIAALGITAPSETTRGDGEGIAHRRTVVREERAPFITSVRSHPWPGELPLRRKGGRINDLSGSQRLFWVVAIMMGIALSTGMFLAGTNALVELALSAGTAPELKR